MFCSLTFRVAKGGGFGMFSMFKNLGRLIFILCFLTYRGAEGGGFGMFSKLVCCRTWSSQFHVSVILPGDQGWRFWYI